MRNSVDVRPASKPAWRKWRRQYPKWKHIKFLQYKEILQHHNKLLLQKALETGEKIKTPIGTLYFEKYKYPTKIVDGKIRKRKHVDFKLSKQYGKTIYINRANTDGWASRMKFDIRGELKYGKFWKLVKSRYVDRYSKKRWKEDGAKMMEKYIEKI